ncbi:MAG: GAF domain-containing protein [Candidatus Eremiobacteraeota bacterium]|nr:GAF domain-containing protein [Candidatus Eremiobacteraeota bacterium]
MEPHLERDQLALLLRVNTILSSTLELDEVLDNLIEQVVEAFEAERCFVVMRQGDGWRLVAGRALDAEASEQAYNYSRNVIEKVANEGVGLLCTDAANDADFHHYGSITLMSIHSIMCVPLRWGGEVKGVVYADHRIRSGVFKQGHLVLLEAVADQAARALENAALYAELQRVHQSSLEQARAELAETQSQLFEASKLAAVGQLAAGIAHEINNPLGVLALNLTALTPKLAEAGLQRRTELMTRAVGRCRDTIDRLLRFAHPARAERRLFRLDQTLEETVDLLRHGLEKLEIEVECHLEPVEVEGEEAQLAQVFLNLILNARDALAQTILRRLEIACSVEDGQARVRLSDTGVGMPQEVMRRVFEPFFTTKPVGQGVGLGLAVSYQIVKDHGGSLTVDSKPGQGTSFLLQLPLESKCRPES